MNTDEPKKLQCRHCNQALVLIGGQLHSQPETSISQYCWIDEIAGSQLHEVTNERH